MAYTYETRTLDDGRPVLAIKGKINEGFTAAPLVAAIGPRLPVLDLAEVRHISSIGIREFELFLEALGDVTLVNVSPAVAAHLVLMPSLGARVKVESAHLPFTCTSCGTETTATVPFAFGGASANAPTCTCGKKMVLDGLAEQLLPSP